ncbi:MAG: hypothetical protein GY765_21820 [bacterium]|nr:hypothetical protein [bacterium]
MRKKKIWYLLINLLLAGGIVYFLVLRFGTHHTTIDCEYNSRPGEIVDIKSAMLGADRQKDITLFLVFNNIPTLSGIDALNKLQFKYSDRVDVLAVFSRRFKTDIPCGFKYKALSNREIICRYGGKSFGADFFMVLKVDRVLHVEKTGAASAVAYQLMRVLHPELSYTDYAISATALRNKVSGKIRDGNFGLYQLHAGGEREIEDIIADSTEFNFVAAKCSTCMLNEILADLKNKESEGDSKTAVIFSCLSDRYALENIVTPEGIDLYIDNRDEFDLMAAIVGDKAGRIELDKNELTHRNVE